MPCVLLCRSDTMKKLTTTWLQDRPSFKIVLPQLITGTSALSSNWLSQKCRIHSISSHASAEIVKLTGKIGSSVMGPNVPKRLRGLARSPEDLCWVRDAGRIICVRAIVRLHAGVSSSQGIRLLGAFG